MKMLVDGVAFQCAGSEIARIWHSILPALVAQQELDVMVLDRGGLPPLDGVRRIPFPTHKHLYTADDSELIQRVCDFHAIDVFTSTQHTTPLSTPMFLVVHDMIAELSDADSRHRVQHEKAVAIAYARRHVCVSARTRDDLLGFYPTLDRVDVAQVGVDHVVFRPYDRDRAAVFRRQIGLDKRPYLVAHDRYSNGLDVALLFDTVARYGIDAFDILCIADEAPIGRQYTTVLPATVQVEWISASGEELAIALSGAAALVHPSRHEGFGLPVLEAMASGCPVVTTAQGALPEVLGEACLIFDGFSRPGLAGALAQLRSETVQRDLRAAGLLQAARFDWSSLSAAVTVAARETAPLGNDPNYLAFAESWQVLRRMQAMVDADTWVVTA